MIVRTCRIEGNQRYSWIKNQRSWFVSRTRPGSLPALLIWVLWNFAPGATTPLQYHLQNTLHASDAQWVQWNAILLPPSFRTLCHFFLRPLPLASDSQLEGSKI